MTEDLAGQLLQNYGLAPEKLTPFRDGYIVDSGGPHSFIIRKTELSPDRIMFNHLVKTHLGGNGFLYTDRYIINNEGLPYTALNEQNYVIITKINGAEAFFENTYDISKTAVALAAMHEASSGACYDLEKYSFAVKELGKLSDIFRHRVSELKKFKRLAVRGKSFFDYEYAKNADYFISDGERCLEELENSDYKKIAARTLARQSICHHDLTSHNIIFHDENTYITGFDNCCIEIKEYDIANFIRRKMRRTGWLLSDAKIIIDNYRSLCSLNASELEVLKIILRFPQKFWRVVNKFYNSKRSWCEKGCLEKMKDCFYEKDPLHFFLDNFDVLY